jgi:flagellar transcriptional activator FlhD
MAALVNDASDNTETEAVMKVEHLLEEIREANLSYMILAQNLIRADATEAMLRLGLSEEVAGIVAELTPGQILKLAGSSMLMCRFRFDDSVVWNLLLSHSKDKAAASGMHAAILMAGKSAEVAA